MIYSIHPDIENRLCYNIESNAARKALGKNTQFHFDESPTSYLDNWQPLEIEFYSSAQKKVKALPDISPRYGRLYLNQKAYQALSHKISSYGEFLPITSQGETGYLFTIMALADEALDSDLCQKNEWGEITWLAFKEDKIDTALFRTEYDDYMSVFCTQEFKDTCEQSELQGLVFTENLAREPV